MNREDFITNSQCELCQNQFEECLFDLSSAYCDQCFDLIEQLENSLAKEE